ncbi:response regulator [Couchioplanes caeruleus]|uniref:Response regulator receiver protein n=2 Tax=Couchioplanes caeruleus TaxID=56438 RepID=A0A1K0FHA3_9ACTN|nr:response regulator [Couchioplanes caeruleus]OJF12223.1 response regulator receiver protein [Couchioplanes caeruleus subsp. caeruleus]ROP32081.1 response regulator receiver domain-containing protein [Couchioplanes caeruleus]
MSVLLIAEDVDDIAMILVRLFRRDGMTVLRGADGAEAYDLAVEHRPDVILTDLGMPRMDGWELIRAVRGNADLRDTPVAILTGQLQPGDARVTESGACSLLLKPCPNDELRSTIRRLVENGPHGHTFSAAGCLSHATSSL